MEDDKRVNYKLDAINKLINNLKLSISGNKEHDELGENNVIVNLDEISQKITELHEMVKAEFDEFENQHKSESDETQTLLNNRFDKIDAKLDSIKASVDSMKTTIGNKLDTVNSTINKANTDIVAAINAMKSSNDTKNDAIITALQGLVTKVNQNTNNINKVEKLANDVSIKHNSLYTDVNNTLKPKINSIDERVTALENASQS